MTRLSELDLKLGDQVENESYKGKIFTITRGIDIDDHTLRKAIHFKYELIALNPQSFSYSYVTTDPSVGWSVVTRAEQSKQPSISKALPEFDIFANRVPFGLLTGDERLKLLAHKGTFEVYTDSGWVPTVDSPKWADLVTYRASKDIILTETKLTIADTQVLVSAMVERGKLNKDSITVTTMEKNDG